MKPDKQFIVVRESDFRPMRFSGDQFSLVPTRGRSRFFLTSYPEKEAKSLINKSKAYRAKNNFGYTGYLLMRFEPQE